MKAAQHCFITAYPVACLIVNEAVTCKLLLLPWLALLSPACRTAPPSSQPRSQMQESCFDWVLIQSLHAVDPVCGLQDVCCCRCVMFQTSLFAPESSLLSCICQSAETNVTLASEAMFSWCIAQACHHPVSQLRTSCFDQSGSDPSTSWQALLHL